ncbi:zinc finger BED domain-containing protein RICESLEEPER 2-like [Cynara cardunculus var. scolymus]|uniref:zinc finger BED domain-containing protein RICESLEEPER 2-like n=1 Tax=Cynara cardunculus var. scolymus TaxID=59895 RepID=UPI000D629371|nr:zinc finger BED domain-containing protein RICESLEEPER 2-like [Cynara cardunculus var. scolymus]
MGRGRGRSQAPGRSQVEIRPDQGESISGNVNQEQGHQPEFITRDVMAEKMGKLRETLMENSQSKNIEDIGRNATEGNDKDNTTCNDTNESVSMPMGSNISPETEMTGRPNDGTTHLKDHFKICPRRVTKDIKQHILVQEQTTKDVKTSSLSNYNFSVESSRDDLAKMIILHDYPLSIFEHHGFRKYSNGLQPLFKVSCRATIKSDIMKIYKTKRGGVLRCLEENESMIALTSDMWTAGNQNKGYMALTAHYIDANWKLQNRIISFIRVPSPHTADALSQVMIECFMDWNIDNKLSTLTLDNCSTNDALVDRLLGTLSPSSLILKGKLFHMRCCAHIINLIVQDGFSMIEKTIKNVRDSVSFWTCSPKRAQDFRLVARQLGVDCERELVLDCKIRWNSVYTMLNVALEYKDVFTRLSKKEKHYVSLPSEEDWRMTTNVCDKLGLFYRVIETFSVTKYPTSNMFFPLICDIKLSIKSWEDDQNDVIRNMASSMLLKFDKYWGVIHDVMSVAIVLDPRYKLKLINYFFPKNYGVDSKDEVMRIQTLCNDLFEEYKKKHDQHKRKGQSGTTVSSEGKSSSNKASWQLDFENMISEDDMFETTELDDYLSEKLLP